MEVFCVLGYLCREVREGERLRGGFHILGDNILICIRIVLAVGVLCNYRIIPQCDNRWRCCNRGLKQVSLIFS